MMRHLVFLVLLALALVPGSGCVVIRDVGSAPGDHPDASPAPDGAQAGPITFRIGYQFAGGFAPCAQNIFIQQVADTGAEGFIEVIDPAGHTIPVTQDCSACFCPGAMPIEGCSGAGPSVAALAFGDHDEWTWDGETFPLEWNCAAGNHTCQSQATVAPGPYLARFCYSTTADGTGPGYHVGAVTCDDVAFDVTGTARSVEHDIVCSGP